MTMRPITGVLLPAFALAGCHRSVDTPRPPKVESPAELPQQSSTIVVPVDAPLSGIEAALERELPRRLWQINQHQDRCVPAQRVNLGIAKVKVIGDLGCQIVGEVTRGRVRLGGSGDRLTITMPVHAAIAAKKVGGLVSKTATGDAVVHAVARLSIVGNWQPDARVDLDYDWTTPPGIDLLGQRIEFVRKADQRLAPVVAKLERTLPRELTKLNLRQHLDSLWRQAFTVIQLNGDKPPAWMRVTPRQLAFGGYRVQGRNLTLTLGAEALTETFVGKRPPDPAATPLPPPSPTVGQPGLRFFIPVLADYEQLEPVIQRVLRKRAAKGITLPGVGPVDVDFGKVTVYATTGNHLAVGVQAKAKAKDSSVLATKGEVWLTALPVNVPGSQRIEARDVSITGNTDSTVTNLLIRVFSDTAVREDIRQALAHDFAPDYQRVLGSARRAIGSRQEGDFRLAADVTQVRNGVIRVTGQGLFLPVAAEGRASIAYRPR